MHLQPEPGRTAVMLALEWLAVNDHLPQQFWDPQVAPGRGTMSPRPATAAAPWGLRSAGCGRQKGGKSVGTPQQLAGHSPIFHIPSDGLPQNAGLPPQIHPPSSIPFTPEVMAPSSMVGEVSRSPRCTKGWKYLRYDSLSVMPCGSGEAREAGKCVGMQWACQGRAQHTAG